MSSWGFVTDSGIEIEAGISAVSKNRFCQDAWAIREPLNIPHIQCYSCSGESEDEVMPSMHSSSSGMSWVGPVQSFSPRGSL